MDVKVYSSRNLSFINDWIFKIITIKTVSKCKYRREENSCAYFENFKYCIHVAVIYLYYKNRMIIRKVNDLYKRDSIYWKKNISIRI